MRIAVLGPTGVVGDAIVREALRDRRIESILAVSRRALRHTHAKIATALHNNFADFTPLEPALSRVDVIVCALGISWYQAKSEGQYRKITHDYVIACARVGSVANPALHFCFVSGHGATPRGSQAWARIKAETEHDLEAMFGSRLNVFRPGYIHPLHGRERPYWGDTLMRPLLPVRSLLSRWITDSGEVARAVLFAATGGQVPSPATNLDVIAAAATYAQVRSALETSKRVSQV
jgi:uncharacterized protein YbjT (DUF2867 family)